MKAIQDTIEPVARPEKILQFGEGNFLRAFVDWMVDIANEKAGFNGNVVMVQPLERGMAEMINAQKGLYTTVLRGVQDRITSYNVCYTKLLRICWRLFALFRLFSPDLSRGNAVQLFENPAKIGLVLKARPERNNFV